MAFNLAYATTYYSRASGPWTTSSTWSLTSGGTAISSGYPGAGDDVIIEGGYNVSIASSGVENLLAASVTIGSTTAGTLSYPNWNPGSTLTISGDLTIGGSSGSGTLTYSTWGLTITCSRLLKGSGTATMSNGLSQDFTFTGTFTLNSQFNQFRNFIVESSGNVTLSGNIETNGSISPAINAGGTLDLQTYTINIGGYKNFNIYGTLIVGGNSGGVGNSNFPSNFETLVIGSSSTVVYSYNGNQTIYPATYNNLTLSGGGVKSSTGIVSSLNLISGGSNYSCGATLNISGGGGSGASGTANENWDTPYEIQSVTLTSGGSGYTSAPTVSVNGNCGGSGASVTANIQSALTVNGVLTISNCTYTSNTNNLTLGGSASVIINPTATFNINGGTTNLNNRPVTFKSSASGTARLAQVVGTLSNATNVTVERYITASNNRAYRLLSPSLNTSGTIKANWQEGVNNPDAATNVPSGTANFGTHITGTTGNTDGFDVTQNNQPSLYTYTPGNTGTYTAVANTNVNTLSASTGYLLFVRGNRDNLNVLTATTNHSNTTLRTTGTLVTGTQNIATSTADNFVLIGNPYASPILWDATAGLYTGTNATNFENFITIWDPNVSTRGGYVTITSTGTITPPPTTTTNLTQDIQSGQAFFIRVKNGIVGTPNFVVAESNKSTTNNLNVFRPGLQEENLRANLFFTHTDNTRRVADGVVILYNNNNNAGLDGNDAIQMSNTDEDVAISQSGSLLSIESRPLADIGDTVLLNIARLREINYEWEFTATNFSTLGLTAYLQDNFTNTETIISLTGSTVIAFTVTSDVASKAANRFRIVYRPTVPLPVNINSIKAYQKQAGVQVEWIVSNEINLDKYEVEKSNSSFKFELLATVATKANSSTENSYAAFDAKPFSGTNFYRLKAIDKNGEFKYSEIVKVNFANVKSSISVYPNPTKGDQVFINVDNLPTGKYELRVTNTLGQELFKKSLFSNGNTNQQIINTMHWAKGMYNITLVGADTQLQQTIIKQ